MIIDNFWLLVKIFFRFTSYLFPPPPDLLNTVPLRWCRSVVGGGVVWGWCGVVALTLDNPFNIGFNIVLTSLVDIVCVFMDCGSM